MKNKKNYITLLNVISAISVVLLHTNGCFWIFSKERYWFTANIIESIFYFAVPIFFMITGATLLDYNKRYSTKEYFKKRLLKTFIPFIAWSIIGLLFRLFYLKDISIDQLNFNYIWNGIFETKIISIYWFFIPLFIVYLCIPFLASINNKVKRRVYFYIVIIGIILNSVIPFIVSVFNLELSIPITLVIGTEYITYVLIGYLLDNCKIDNKKLIIAYSLALIGLLVHIIPTYILSINEGHIVNTFKGYNNIPCILYSIGIFLLIKKIFNNIKGNYKIINCISKYTFSIYLMHWYIMIIIREVFSLSELSIIYRLGMPIIIIPICILITFILRKIPILKHIVP